MEPYLEEEELGILLLHRQNRLVKIQKQLATQQHDRKKRDDNWQGCETISSRTADDIINNNALLVKVNDELEKVHGEYWEHQLRLNKLITTHPTNKIIVNEAMIPRLHRDRYNRPYIWGHDQKECATRGGCCGRNCGCYEKALDWYLAPVEDPEREQRKFMGDFRTLYC